MVTMPYGNLTNMSCLTAEVGYALGLNRHKFWIFYDIAHLR